ncbi:GT4 family glycosyltransferase PelF [Sulfurospirillum sp. 1612]|uniref:GT4 family glycosyltransferase PelF n=1 Tax=Sulfurospirillum sp. 1612 TaxID=3094835 RepID=UPI002F92B8F8
MTKYIRQAKHVDVMLLAEGTYPYIRGGVSSWIAQILEGLTHIQFGICFIGSRADDYDGIKYELPDNLVHLEVHYIAEEHAFSPEKREGNKEAFKAISALHESFEHSQSDLPPAMRDIDFYINQVPFEDFLYSRQSWQFINKHYMKHCPNIPFIDYFWTLKNSNRSIWVLAEIAANFPSVKVFHAPSTGFAGFLGGLAAHSFKKPFVLTEHGIYTRERKIDMLTAQWIDYKKPSLLKQPEELNYIKSMWVKFFEKIGYFSYERANLILSLYPGAQKIQVAFGAKPNKTRVIPNGVDVDALHAIMRPEDAPCAPVITLIGRVVSIKDIKTFIRAIRIVVNTIKEAEAWIVGPMDEDVEYADECVKMVESLNLQKHVRFLGFKSITEILPKTKLLTLTSISEGMPLVILEGFAAGIPCVATDVGSCKDLIEGGLDDEDIALGSAGALSVIANPSELAEQYIHFLSDEDAWKKARAVALKRVEKYYRKEIFLDKYDAIYHDMMKET